MLEEGYQPVSPQELETLYTGKTVTTTGGKDYYGPNGSYVSLWKGTIYEGTWRTEEPNKMCWNVAEWGSIPCAEWYKSGDTFKGVYKDRVCQRAEDCTSVQTHCGGCSCGTPVARVAAERYEAQFEKLCAVVRIAEYCEMDCPPPAPSCTAGYCVAE